MIMNERSTRGSPSFRCGFVLQNVSGGAPMHNTAKVTGSLWLFFLDKPGDNLTLVKYILWYSGVKCGLLKA